MLNEKIKLMILIYCHQHKKKKKLTLVQYSHMSCILLCQNRNVEGKTCGNNQN